MFLKLARTRWARVLRDQEEYLRSVTGNQLSDPNVTLQEKQAFDDYLKHMLGLLEINLQLVDPLQKKTWHGAHAVDVEYEELKEDYKFLIAKMRSQIQQNASTIPVITAMMAVEESRKAIEQANDVKALTTLATIYIPLSFIAGVFGMNVKTFDPDINVPIWSFFAIALPATALSMVLVWYWNSILRAGPLIRDAFVTLIKRLVERFRISPIPRGGVAKGLALGGGTSIAVGRPFLPTTHRMNDEMMNMRAYEEAGV
ncbi:hypothetical protein DL98DRAFT_406303 [Cadophora sp. DSE1049]|nr:hypothetical protein DL98DRAFT_406303 [Cadophora sp. DSE1049]